MHSLTYKMSFIYKFIRCTWLRIGLKHISICDHNPLANTASLLLVPFMQVPQECRKNFFKQICSTKNYPLLSKTIVIFSFLPYNYAFLLPITSTYELLGLVVIDYLNRVVMCSNGMICLWIEFVQRADLLSQL